MKVFVYGSLKKGHWNNSVLGESQFIGEATTMNNFILTDCGFPYMIYPSKLGQPTAKVKGELYEVDNPIIQEDLDCLEGHPHHYKRQRIMVSNDSNQLVEAVAYIAAGDNGLGHPLCKIVNDHYVWEG